MSDTPNIVSFPGGSKRRRKSRSIGEECRVIRKFTQDQRAEGYEAASLALQLSGAATVLLSNVLMFRQDDPRLTRDILQVRAVVRLIEKQLKQHVDPIMLEVALS